MEFLPGANRTIFLLMDTYKKFMAINSTTQGMILNVVVVFRASVEVMSTNHGVIFTSAEMMP